jgi:hypothetical protein
MGVKGREMKRKGKEEKDMEERKEFSLLHIRCIY